MATSSKWCSAPHRQAAALPRRPVLLAATPQTGKIVQAVVERTIGWISRNRRLARDFERHCRIAAAFVRMAMIRIMLRRLAAKPSA
jgi:phage-related baseplate assembly protein